MKLINLNSIISITRKDFKVFLKDRSSVLYLFIVPILFILAFGGSSSGENKPVEEVIPLPIVDLDNGSEASQTLFDALNHAGIQCISYDQEQGESDLNKEKINRMLVVPKNYGKDLESGRTVALNLVTGPDANPSKTEAVSRMVSGVAADLSLKTQLIGSFRQMADMQAAGSSDEQIFTSEMIIQQAQSQFERAKTEPLLSINEKWPQHLLEEGEDAFSHLSVFVPGFAILFIFLAAQATAQSIYQEKKIGSFRRLLAAPLSKVTILLGKILPNFITGLIQILVLFGFGLWILPLFGIKGMTLGNDLPAFVLLCLILLLCSTSLGVLIVAIARTEGQVSGLSQVVLWAFGFAGIWFHRMPLPQPFDKIGLVIPHYWANSAFLDLMIRGGGLSDILPSIWILLGFTVVFFTIGLWRFDFN